MVDFQDLRDGIDRKSLTFLFSGLLLGAVLVFIGMNQGNVSGERIAQDLESTLEQSTGQSLEIINIDRQNGLYRVQLRDSENQLTTYYMTRDGELVAQESGFTDFNDFRRRVSAQASFSDCMSDREVVMFGNSSQRATLAQIQLLGGANQVTDIYADVNNEPVLEQAVRLGISRTPAFYYGNQTIQGVQTVPQLGDFTGCQYNFSTEN